MAKRNIKNSKKIFKTNAILIVILFTAFFISIFENSTMANTISNDKEYCLTPEEQKIIKIRIIKDNLFLVKRKCALSKIEKGYFHNLKKFFNANDDNLITLYKKLYEDSHRKELNNLITENSNQASVKYSYDKKYFCNSYKYLLLVPSADAVIKKTEKFQIPQTNHCN